jgi:glycosyltransferase involved in cell wall biosynthesis
MKGKTTSPIINRVCGRYFKLPPLPGDSYVVEGGKRVDASNDRKEPLISIVTVVRNNVESIARCIDSVEQQSFENYEHIVIDGSSSDGTLEIIERYEKFLEYFISQSDDGIYFAMNKGLSLARGAFVVFLNSDDWLPQPSTLESIASSLDKGKPSIVYGRANYYDGFEFKHTSYDVMRDDNFFSKTTSLPHQATYVHSDIYNTLGGFDTNYKVAADAIWCYRAKITNCEFYFVNKIWVNYSIDGYSGKYAAQARIELLVWSFRHGVCDAEYIRTFIGTSQSIKDEKEIRKSCAHLNGSFPYLENFLDTIFETKRKRVLIANDDHFNHYNSYLEKSLNLIGYDVDFSSKAFFKKKRYNLVIIEWPEYLLDEVHHPGQLKIKERVTKVLNLIDFYCSIGRVISIVHNNGSHKSKASGDRVRIDTEDMLQREIYRKSNLVFHLGQYSRSFFSKQYGLKKESQYILPHFPYSSYPVSGNLSGARMRLKLGLDKKIIAFIGAVRSWEEVTTTIQIFNGIKEPRALLVIIGRCADVFAAKFRLSLGNRVYISDGYVSDEEIGNYVAAADAVLISRVSSLNSGVLFLAISLSRPVLIAESGNSTEYSSKFGFETFRGVDDGVIKLATILRERARAGSTIELISNSHKLFTENGIEATATRLKNALESRIEDDSKSFFKNYFSN